MESILITGCNRGIGLGLVQRLTQLTKPPKNIFATCRDVNKAEVSLFFVHEAGNETLRKS